MSTVRFTSPTVSRTPSECSVNTPPPSIQKANSFSISSTHSGSGNAKRTQPSKSFRRSPQEKAIFHRGDKVEDIEGFKGVVVWSGVISVGDINGQYYGIVWEEGAERGNLDGSFRGKRYFRCDPSCGSLCTSSQIRLQRSSVSEGVIMRQRQTHRKNLQMFCSAMDEAGKKMLLLRYVSRWATIVGGKRMSEMQSKLNNLTVTHTSLLQSMSSKSSTSLPLLPQLAPPEPSREVHCYCIIS
eukprot:PhF_6_TR44528/c0_g1_i2/m.68594